MKKVHEIAVQSGKAGLNLRDGAFYLFKGARWLLARPKMLILGAAPAAIVAAFMVLLVGILLFNIVDLVRWITPFTDTWAPVLATVVQIMIGLALVAALIGLCVVLFAALTLAVGQKIYDRIWKEVEVDAFGVVAAEELREEQSPHSPWGMVWRSALTSGAMFAVGFIPVVGGLISMVINPVNSGWLLAGELTQRAFEARGYSEHARKELLKKNRPATLGFGVALHFSFLVPLGAIVLMPAAVVGATMYAHTLVGAGQEDGAHGNGGSEESGQKAE